MAQKPFYLIPLTLQCEGTKLEGPDIKTLYDGLRKIMLDYYVICHTMSYIIRKLKGSFSYTLSLHACSLGGITEGLLC